MENTFSTPHSVRSFSQKHFLTIYRLSVKWFWLHLVLSDLIINLFFFHLNSIYQTKRWLYEKSIDTLWTRQPKTGIVHWFEMSAESHLHSISSHWKRFYHDDFIKWKHLFVTGPLWGDSLGHWWISPKKASGAELWCFLWYAPEQKVEAPSRLLWRHYNDCGIIPRKTVWFTWRVQRVLSAAHISRGFHTIKIPTLDQCIPNILFEIRYKFLPT